ncbi:MAG: rod-binding protein [Actinomycetota bacterium]
MSIMPAIGPADPSLTAEVRAPVKKATTAAQAEKAGRQFEGMFLSQMLQHMFEGVNTDKIFGGGNGEKMFRSLLMDEYGKMIANRGNGIGIATAVRNSLLHAQEVH